MKKIGINEDISGVDSVTPYSGVVCVKPPCVCESSIVFKLLCKDKWILSRLTILIIGLN